MGNNIQRLVIRPLLAIMKIISFKRSDNAKYTKVISNLFADMVYSKAVDSKKIGIRGIPPSARFFGSNEVLSNGYMKEYVKSAAKIYAASRSEDAIKAVAEVTRQIADVVVPHTYKIAKGIQNNALAGMLTTEDIENLKSLSEGVAQVAATTEDTIESLEFIQSAFADQSLSPVLMRIAAFEQVLTMKLEELNLLIDFVNKTVAIAQETKNEDVADLAKIALIELERIIDNAAIDVDTFEEKRDKTPRPYKMPRSGMSEQLMRGITRLVDKNHPWYKLQQELDAGKLNTSEDIHSRFDLAQPQTMAEENESNIRYKQTMLRQLAKAGISVKAFSQFLAYRHAIERNEQIDRINKALTGRGSGIPTYEAMAYMEMLKKESPDKLAAMQETAKLFDTMTSWTLDNAVAAGRISEAEAKAMKTRYKHWAPLAMNIGDENTDDLIAGMADEYSSSGGKQKIKRATGRFTRPNLGRVFDYAVSAHMQSIRDKFAMEGWSALVRNIYSQEREDIHRLISSKEWDGVWTTDEAGFVAVRGATKDHKEYLKDKGFTWSDSTRSWNKAVTTENRDLPVVIGVEPSIKAYIKAPMKEAKDEVNVPHEQVKYKMLAHARTKEGHSAIVLRHNGRKVTLVLKDRNLIDTNAYVPTNKVWKKILDAVRQDTNLVSITTTIGSASFALKEAIRNPISAFDNFHRESQGIIIGEQSRLQ
jgi:hypothetical protein